MARHELKTWPEYYEAVLRGDKTFEVRVDDRGGFDVDDVLTLHEWDPTRGYTKRVMDVVVKYVLRDPKFGVAPGYVVMGIGAPPEVVERRRVSLVRIFDLASIVSLWAALLTIRSTSWQLAVACQVLATIFVGSALFVRGRQ